MTKTLRVLLGLALVGLLALVVAGCGSSSGGSGTDTAKIAPAASFFYAEANIDPTGSQESAMRSILGDFPGTGAPQDRLNNLLEKASKSDKRGPNVDYLKDVKPWLGDKAAVFVTQDATTASKVAWAVAVATTDEGKAKDTIKKGKQAGDRDASYKGIDYVVDKGGTATGVVGGFFVAGSEAGMKQAIDASKGQSLADADRYKQAIKSARSERVALVYEDLGGLLQAVSSAGGQSLGPAAPLIGRLFGGQPVVTTIHAEQQALVVDGSLFPPNGFLNLSGQSTPLLDQVPSDAWLAAGVKNFGQAIKSLFGLVAGAAGGQQALEQQLKTAAGIDLQQDLFSWIGDVAFFVNGDSKATIGGGALIKSTNPTASRKALAKFALLANRSGKARASAVTVGKASGFKLSLNSAPKGIYMVQGGDTVAIAYGDAAAKSAFAGGPGLTSSSGYKDAAAKLGDGYSPSFYLTFAPILNLAQSFGASSKSWQQAQPYLTALDYVIAGSAKSGSGSASRLRVGFKPHS